LRATYTTFQAAEQLLGRGTAKKSPPFLRLRERFSEVIVDTDARTASVSARHSDGCILVAGPSWDERIRDEQLLDETATRHKKPLPEIYLLLNRTYPRFSVRSLDGIEPCEVHMLPNRQAISASMAGWSVIETHAKETDPVAFTAMQELFESIYGPYQEQTIDRISVAKRALSGSYS
jgi:hypothetical protein